jgi:hypothetical protein
MQEHATLAIDDITAHGFDRDPPLLLRGGRFEVVAMAEDLKPEEAAKNHEHDEPGADAEGEDAPPGGMEGGAAGTAQRPRFPTP